MPSYFRPPTVASDSYESPAASCLGLLDRAIARGSGCERLINDFGGPEGVRAALLKSPKNQFPAKSYDRASDYVPMATRRLKWLAPLQPGDRLTQADTGLCKDHWHAMMSAIVKAGFLTRPEPGVVIRTDKPNMPTETADVQAEMHQMTGKSRARITPQATRESHLREIQPGQTVSRPDHITPTEWSKAMHPLVALGYLEAVGHTDALSVVKRTGKPDMPTNTSTLRAATSSAAMKGNTNRKGRSNKS